MKMLTHSWDLLFEGYQVWAFKTNIAEDFVSGQPNSDINCILMINRTLLKMYM